MAIGYSFDDGPGEFAFLCTRCMCTAYWQFYRDISIAKAKCGITRRDPREYGNEQTKRRLARHRVPTHENLSLSDDPICAVRPEKDNKIRPLLRCHWVEDLISRQWLR